VSKLELLFDNRVVVKKIRKYRCVFCLSDNGRSTLFTIDKLLNHLRGKHCEHSGYSPVRNILKKIQLAEKMGIVV